MIHGQLCDELVGALFQVTYPLKNSNTNTLG